MARAPGHKHKKAMRQRIAEPVREPPVPDELASPACYAHEVDPAYMFAPSPSAPTSPPEDAVKSAPSRQGRKPEPAKEAKRTATPKPPRPAPVAKPLPHDRGRGRLRVGRARRDRPR
jgi:hypothetical protein